MNYLLSSARKGRITVLYTKYTKFITQVNLNTKKLLIAQKFSFNSLNYFNTESFSEKKVFFKIPTFS